MINIQKQVDKEVDRLGDADLRRPAMSIKDFIEEHSKVLARVQIDKSCVEKAGFNWERFPVFVCQFENLVLVHGERTGTKLKSPQVLAAFNRDLEKVKSDRKLLKAVAGYVVKNSGSKRAAIKMRRIPRTNSKTALLTSCLDLISIIQEFPQLSRQIRPAGRELTSDNLQEISNRVLSLLKRKGVVVVNGIPQNALVARQNRLVTLCLRAQATIKEFASAAFIEDPEYYKKYYCSERRKHAGAVEEVAVV